MVAPILLAVTIMLDASFIRRAVVGPRSSRLDLLYYEVPGWAPSFLLVVVLGLLLWMARPRRLVAVVSMALGPRDALGQVR